MACLLAGALVIAAPSGAQIYKWTDASGTVHFSDSPPPRGQGAPKVEVLPKTTHVPPPTRTVEERDEPTPESMVEAPRDQDAAPPADDYAREPADDYVHEPDVQDMEMGADAVIVDDPAGDRAVERRANSPRNRPGEPIRSVPRARR